MLVVVHHRNVHFRLKPGLYLKTFGSFYILKIDTSESRSESLDY